MNKPTFHGGCAPVSQLPPTRQSTPSPRPYAEVHRSYHGHDGDVDDAETENSASVVVCLMKTRRRLRATFLEEKSQGTRLGVQSRDWDELGRGGVL